MMYMQRKLGQFVRSASLNKRCFVCHCMKTNIELVSYIKRDGTEIVRRVCERCLYLNHGISKINARNKQPQVRVAKKVRAQKHKSGFSPSETAAHSHYASVLNSTRTYGAQLIKDKLKKQEKITAKLQIGRKHNALRSTSGAPVSFRHGIQVPLHVPKEGLTISHAKCLSPRPPSGRPQRRNSSTGASGCYAKSSMHRPLRELTEGNTAPFPMNSSFPISHTQYLQEFYKERANEGTKRIPSSGFKKQDILQKPSITVQQMQLESLHQ